MMGAIMSDEHLLISAMRARKNKKEIDKIKNRSEKIESFGITFMVSVSTITIFVITMHCIFWG
jgi:hypothetical protein